MLVKILGLIDLIAAFSFLSMIFGVDPFFQIKLFAAGILFVKSMFMFSGDILSVIDFVSAILLILSIFFALPSIVLWVPAFLLLAKGMVSFL